MNGWRGAWAASQITGVLFSSLVWIVVWGLSLPALVAMLVIGVTAVAGRDTRPMLWWRYGAVRASDFQRGAVLTAIVPIASLRGRNQPIIWIGRRLGGGQVVMPSCTILVVSSEFLRRVVTGQLTDRQASAVVSQALGHCPVHSSTLVNAMDAYCLPWRFVQIVTGVVSGVAARNPVFGFSWKIRWIVFGLAAVDAYRNARWAAFVGVVLIAILSWSTGPFDKRWIRELEDLGDHRAVAEGLGPDLADLIRRSDGSLAASERAERLRHGSSNPMAGGGGLTPRRSNSEHIAPAGSPRSSKTYRERNR